MVNRLVEPGSAVQVALELAGRIARNAPLALAASKQILAETSGMSDEDFWNHQRPLFEEVFSSSDSLEGARAFAEKRPPQWQGK
jgi:enoyl-CoA hydratase